MVTVILPQSYVFVKRSGWRTRLDSFLAMEKVIVVSVTESFI